VKLNRAVSGCRHLPPGSISGCPVKRRKTMLRVDSAHPASSATGSTEAPKPVSESSGTRQRIDQPGMRATTRAVRFAYPGNAGSRVARKLASCCPAAIDAASSRRTGPAGRPDMDIHPEHDTFTCADAALVSPVFPASSLHGAKARACLRSSPMKFCLALITGLLALSACQAGNSLAADPTTAPSARSSLGNTIADAGASGLAHHSATDEAVTLECADTGFHLRKEHANGAARPALFVGAGRAGKPVVGPAELAGYDPVGIACVTSARTGGQWLAVQYGGMEGGCGFCEWIHLYDARGRLLTRSDPPILSDASLPPAQQQLPNNREFTRLSEELQLDRPEFIFLPRD
jgi:hypothetical protein